MSWADANWWLTKEFNADLWNMLAMTEATLDGQLPYGSGTLAMPLLPARAAKALGKLQGLCSVGNSCAWRPGAAHGDSRLQCCPGQRGRQTCGGGGGGSTASTYVAVVEACSEPEAEADDDINDGTPYLADVAQLSGAILFCAAVPVLSLYSVRWRPR